MTWPNCTEAAKRTGWPPGLLQDDDRKLSRWFAGRLGARGLIVPSPAPTPEQVAAMVVARRRYVESYISAGDAA